LVEGHMTSVLSVSTALWCLAKLGYGMTAVPNSGYFDLVSWQLLFVVGICFGFRPLKKNNQDNVSRIQGVLILPSIIIVLIFFSVRHERFFTGTNLSPYWLWLSSWRRTLSVARLLNFSAVAFLIYRFRRSFELFLNNSLSRAFVFLGRHSLPVFVWSVSTSMLACANAIYPKWVSASPLQQTTWVLLILASCFVPAWLHSKWQQLSKVMAEKNQLVGVT
jgi:hypothetical protein